MSSTRAAWIVLKKELKETLRDRKTLLIMVVLPLVLYPLIFLGLAGAAQVQAEKLASEELAVGLAGQPPPGGLQAHLEAMEATTLQRVEEAEQAVQAGEVLAALVVSQEALDALASEGKATIKLVFDGGSDRSREAEQRVREAVNAWTKEVRSGRLERKQVTQDYVDAVAIDKANVAPPTRQGGYMLGQILPMLVSLLMIGAAFYPAIDLTAGEKERGTLQTLLTAPIKPIAVVGGKYLAVVALTLMTGLMNLLSITLVAVNIPLPEEIAGELSFDFGVGVFVAFLVCLLLIGMMFGAIMMAVAVTAKSFKEAQNYLTPLYLVCVFPLLVAGLPGIELSETTAVIPLVNLALAMKQMLVGPVAAELLLAVFLSTAAWIALALVLATRVFRMESVLLGDAGIKALFHRAGAGVQRPPVPTIAEVVTLLGVVLLGLFYGSAALAGAPLLTIIHVTQWLLILAPAVALVFALRLDARQSFSLRRPPAWSMVSAALFGVGLWLAATLILEWLAQDWQPVPSPDWQALTDRFRELGSSPGTAVLLFLGVAVAPAVCEEALFRGVVLSALSRRLRAGPAVIISSALFAVYHMNLYQLPTTFVVGLVAGYLVVRSRSLWPAVLLHALHNGLTLGFQLYAADALSQDWLLALLLGPALAVVVLWRRRRDSALAPEGAPSRTDLS